MKKAEEFAEKIGELFGKKHQGLLTHSSRLNRIAALIREAQGEADEQCIVYVDRKTNEIIGQYRDDLPVPEDTTLRLATYHDDGWRLVKEATDGE